MSNLNTTPKSVSANVPAVHPTDAAELATVPTHLIDLTDLPTEPQELSEQEKQNIAGGGPGVGLGGGNNNRNR